MHLHQALYMPQLKWKAGEVRALASLPRLLAERTLPVLKITPGGGFDAIERRVISTVENIALFGRRLGQAWGRRLVFIDAALIDKERDSRRPEQHPLTELLERARLEGASAAPIVRLDSSTAYKEAVRRFCLDDSSAPICLRVDLAELEKIASLSSVKKALESLGTRSEKCVLLIDAGPIHVEEPQGLVNLLASHLARLAPQGAWLRVVWGGTTFPKKPKLRAGELGRYARSDWRVYQAIANAIGDFATVPLFSDYALEYPGDYAPARVPPTAHFRYSTDREYLIFKGTTTRKPNGYAAIYSVAKRIVISNDFMGKGFSLGDAYMDTLTQPNARTGNASMWRWASTDHHFRLVHAGLASLFGLPKELLEAAPVPEQLALV